MLTFFISSILSTSLRNYALSHFLFTVGKGNTDWFTWTRENKPEKYFKPTILSTSLEQTVNPQHKNHTDHLHSVRSATSTWTICCLYGNKVYRRLYPYHLACNTSNGNTASTNSCNDFEITPQHPGQVPRCTALLLGCLFLDCPLWGTSCGIQPTCSFRSQTAKLARSKTVILLQRILK